MNNNTFFLRFYGRSKEEIEDFLSNLKRDYPTIRRYSLESMTQSMNIFVLTPANMNWEAILFFENEADIIAFKQDPIAFSQYQAMATPDNLKSGATYHLRKLGDTVYGM